MSDYLDDQALQAEVAGVSQKEMLVKILAETRRTNGRVTRVERVVFGDDQEGVSGIVAVTSANRKLLEQASTAVKVAKYLLPFVGLGQIIQVILMLQAGS